MVDDEFETTASFACLHAQQVEAVLRGCGNRTASVWYIEFQSLVNASAGCNPLCVALNIGLTIVVGVNEDAVAGDSVGSGDEHFGIRAERGRLIILDERFCAGAFLNLVSSAFVHREADVVGIVGVFTCGQVVEIEVGGHLTGYGCAVGQTIPLEIAQDILGHRLIKTEDVVVTLANDVVVEIEAEIERGICAAALGNDLEVDAVDAVRAGLAVVDSDLEIAVLNDEFVIDISVDDLVPENFNTLDAIVELVESM